jgi:sugar phosphate isomerase/epimerase
MTTPKTFCCIAKLPPRGARRLGLCLEINSAELQRPRPDVLALARSFHLPFDFGEWPSLSGGRQGRLSIAAIDPELRERSIACIEHAMQEATRASPIETAVMHLAPRYWWEDDAVCPPGQAPAAQTVGEYAILIESIRRLGRLAERLGIRLVMENNRAYWDGIVDGTDFATVDRTAVREYFGTSPFEWLQIWHDVAHPSVALCLDTSHATTWVHRFPPGQRSAMLDAFFACPQALWHVHWNGNTPDHPEGRKDRHMPLGQDTLGDRFHRAVLALPARFHLLEHFVDVPTLEKELAYIAGLSAQSRL